ncbi:selenocysteine-specific elongation factor [Anaeramoeba ignava]|uniref:Selenocysteine-specific elongation factor n=1 Tax=Anaeramoeba ignava TaxID=1746090 RepID=A0A9Q0LUH2_ANAIG|nr:selenocysteine-specific elongation factor [Anaeramoeba ignava]
MNLKSKPFNVSIAILGHVDSGKTTLAKMISTTKSTAAFDKSPQSQERKITLDLGFSSTKIPIPEHLQKRAEEMQIKEIQFTFVDCPGHASLIRTVVGGSQIIDMAIMVIDITKGIQTQTAEDFIIASIWTNKMVIVLNKTDLLPEEKLKKRIELLEKHIKKALSDSPFGNSPIVSVSALQSKGNELVMKELQNMIEIPERINTKNPFVMLVDHCFNLKGKGTIITGTIIQGSCSVSDTIEFPSLNEQRRIKSMQIFHEDVLQAEKGDRVGICISQFDSKLFERGIVCQPGAISSFTGAIALFNRIKFFKHPIKSRSKLHITIGHETVMTKFLFFKPPKEKKEVSFDNFTTDLEYLYVDEFKQEDSPIFALLKFEKKILALNNSLLIGGKLEIPLESNECRIAFSGQIINGFNWETESKSLKENLKIASFKFRTGLVDRVQDSSTLIGKDLFGKGAEIKRYSGTQVSIENKDGKKTDGTIISSFGKTGKFKIRIDSNDSSWIEVGNIIKMRKTKYVFLV